MSLSNLREEFGREITETAVGFGVVLLLPIILMGLAAVFPVAATFWASVGSWILVLMVVVSVVGVFGLVLFICVSVVHSIGEDICNFLARRGHELRPRRRL